MNDIQLVITDFDGTLVDTFEANFRAYENAFAKNNLSISREQYKACFGFRFDKFMEAMDINDDEIKDSIREIKARVYSEYFEHLILNNTLISLIIKLKKGGCKTAIASTARQMNLMNVLNYYNLEDIFDLILAGEDVINGKPNPEIYLSVMDKLGIMPEHTLVFEDSKIGFESATAAGTKFIQIGATFFE